METSDKLTERMFSVPQDMSIDVLALIIKNKLKHEIIEINENRSLIVLVVFYNEKAPRHQSIIENIKEMLNDYQDWRWAENERINGED